MKRKRFLKSCDETGRQMVYSNLTGIKYYIEPITSGKVGNWGDVNPATGKVEGNYGSKYRGAITKEESLITEENGFENIGTVVGSPYSEINKRDDAHYKRMQTT